MNLQLFLISGIFPTCFGCFLSDLQMQQTKNMLIYKSFTKPYWCSTKASSKCTCDCTGPRQDLKPSRLRLGKWEVLRWRPNVEAPSLP